MNLNELRALPPEQAMQAAAKDLALPENFFDRMWAQESGRGQNMRSPAGARGHFQIMPATQRAWEQRHGTAYNPDDFYEGLVMAHATMKENLAKFKDPVDATRAYNGGWDPARWDNPETSGYVTALWGDTPPRLPSLKKPKDQTSPRDALALAVLETVGREDADASDASRAAFEAKQATAAKEQARKDAAGLGDAFSGGLRDPHTMPTWALLRYLTDTEPADPSYDWMARREGVRKQLGGFTDEEEAFFIENARSLESETRAAQEVMYQRDLNRTYADAGAYNAFAGQMAAGVLDPVSLVTGVAVGKAFQVARIVNNARRGGAVAGLLAEGAAANAVIEGIADVSGEVKTSSDYAMAAITGAAFVAPFARGVHRQAANAEVARLAQGLNEAAATEQIAKVSKVLQDEPHLSPEQVARRVEEHETTQIKRAVDEVVGPQRQDPVVPNDVRTEMEREFLGEPDPATPEPVKSAKEQPDDFADTVIELSTVERLDQLRKGELSRQVQDTSGGTIKLSWSANGTKLPRHGTIAEALTAVQSHPLATPADKRLATYLTKVMSKDGLAVDIRFTAREGASNYDPNGPGVAINNHGTGTSGAAGRSGLVEQVMGLTKTGLYAVLHETVHVATYHRINAWEAAADKLRADQRRVLGQFEDLFNRFRKEVEPMRATRSPNNGALYAAKNLHEFAAQVMTDRETRFVLSMMNGKSVAGRASDALREFLNIIRRILGLAEKHTGFDEAVKLIDQMIAMPVDNVKFANGAPVFAPDTRARVTETPEFKRWFGKSKIVNPDGSPQVMYHGTTASFTKFEADKNGLIFVTPDPAFTGQFTGPKGGNVMPLYVSAERPFDPTVPADRTRLVDRLMESHPQYTMGDGQQALVIDGRNTLYTEAVLHETLKNPESNWTFIETPSILDHIERLGFDSVFVVEDGIKNLAVFEPQQLKSATGNNGQFDPYKPSIVEAPQEGAQVNPLISRRKRDTWAERMTQYAQDYIARNPINQERLKTLTAKIGGVSDGLVLAASKNPIMQLVASLVTETTTGAAGRKANVAIRSQMLARKFVGNALIDYDGAYATWRARNGGGVMEDMFAGEKRRQFDQAVYSEILQRRGGSYTPSPDRAVVGAADALEGLFERARVGQVDAGVLGWANLPSSAKGYIPQALDGVKLQAASVKDLGLLHEALAAQFEARLGWDRDFARDFAPFYTERARRRAMGDKGLEALGAGGEGLQLVRDTLQEMQADASLVDRARAAESKLGQSHTKKRLDVDLLQELRPGLRMMDFYNTNPLLLARSYAKRTAGTVALTDAGIHGIRGVRELRQAALYKQDGTQPTAAELDAFDRVMAEILGTPVAGAVVSGFASNMSLLVGLQRLGGLVFTQAAETFNMIHHLGLRATLSGIADLPRIMGEVGRLKRGAASENHILTSIEQYGGEIGTETFKMVAPLDAPEARLGEYVDQPGVITRLLRAGGHLQSKISGFRGLMAAQHRMVAEQIVMRAARLIRDGSDTAALRDMGFTPDLVAAMKGDLQYIAKWDGNDRLQEFDLTRVSDARTAEAFVQAVHRGTSQIIQGSFVGERNKWFHSDYLRLLLQLRTFGLTATEKQWARTVQNHGGGLQGYAYAGGMLLGHMALALPIHLARVQLASMGRADREDYIKDNTRPAALVKATMNYASLSGLTSDVLDVLTGLAGGLGGKETAELLGGRTGTQALSVGKIVPAAGTVDSLLRVASGRSDLHQAVKQLPFSNLWYLLPAVNLTKDD